MKRLMLTVGTTLVCIASGCGASPTVPPTPLNPTTAGVSTMTTYGPASTALSAPVSSSTGMTDAVDPTTSTPQVATATTPTPSPTPTATPEPDPSPTDSPATVIQVPDANSMPAAPAKTGILTKVKNVVKGVWDKIFHKS